MYSKQGPDQELYYSPMIAFYHTRDYNYPYMRVKKTESFINWRVTMVAYIYNHVVIYIHIYTYIYIDYEFLTHSHKPYMQAN